MENLKRVGAVYNEFCDRIEEQKKTIRKHSKTRPTGFKELILNDNRKLRQLKADLKEYKHTLTRDELDAFNDYRRIRFDIRRCEVLKKADKVESSIFRKLSPVYIYDSGNVRSYVFYNSAVYFYDYWLVFQGRPGKPETVCI
jgi:hypothetical protein